MRLANPSDVLTVAPMRRPILFRNSDETFWQEIKPGSGIFAQVELADRSYWPGRAWMKNGVVESLTPNPDDFDLVGDELARSMWDCREATRQQKSLSA